MVALRQWFQLILCRTLIERDKANRYLAPSLLLPPSWSKVSKMLDDTHVDVKIVVTNDRRQRVKSKHDGLHVVQVQSRDVGKIPPFS